MFLNNRITGKGKGRLLVWFASNATVTNSDVIEQKTNDVIEQQNDEWHLIERKKKK